MQSIPDVSWSRIAAFVRQHAHDLRNDLNALDLDAALLAELVTDAEAREGVKRMRAGIKKIATDLRALSNLLAAPHPAPRDVAARELFALWQEAGGAAEVEWTDALGDEHVNVDPNGIGWAFHELFSNASAFRSGGTLRATARAADGGVTFELREPKSAPTDTSRWGRAPFESTRPGHYGLGLCALVRTISANGGTVAWRFAEAERELVTTICFPAVV
jgi:hypothetical protein